MNHLRKFLMLSFVGSLVVFGNVMGSEGVVTSSPDAADLPDVSLTRRKLVNVSLEEGQTAWIRPLKEEDSHSLWEHLFGNPAAMAGIERSGPRNPSESFISKDQTRPITAEEFRTDCATKHGLSNEEFDARVEGKRDKAAKSGLQEDIQALRDLFNLYLEDKLPGAMNTVVWTPGYVDMRSGLWAKRNSNPLNSSGRAMVIELENRETAPEVIGFLSWAFVKERTEIANLWITRPDLQAKGVMSSAINIVATEDWSLIESPETITVDSTFQPLVGQESCPEEHPTAKVATKELGMKITDTRLDPWGHRVIMQSLLSDVVAFARSKKELRK